jgi:hypothetical protein
MLQETSDLKLATRLAEPKINDVLLIFNPRYRHIQADTFPVLTNYKAIHLCILFHAAFMWHIPCCTISSCRYIYWCLYHIRGTWALNFVDGFASEQAI